MAMLGFFSRWKEDRDYAGQDDEAKSLTRIIIIALVMTTLVLTALGIYWSQEQDRFDVSQEALEKSGHADASQLPLGYTFTFALTRIGETLLDKPGGYITNDVMPPGIILDNIKNWEFGALVMLRDASAALRNNFSRSQSQSEEDPDLAVAEPFFNYQNDSWALPSTEGEYKKGIKHLENYLNRLNEKAKNTNFYARADNLRQYIEVVGQRLGDLSHRLSASGSQYQSEEAKLDPEQKKIRTVWFKVDDNFYEARGAAWALLHIMKAIEKDFEPVLTTKHAMETFRNMIQELENALEPTVSPIVLNGEGFGIFANYSLTMANFIARANAAALDLRDIMMRG